MHLTINIGDDTLQESPLAHVNPKSVRTLTLFFVNLHSIDFAQAASILGVCDRIRTLCIEFDKEISWGCHPEEWIGCIWTPLLKMNRLHKLSLHVTKKTIRGPIFPMLVLPSNLQILVISGWIMDYRKLDIVFTWTVKSSLLTQLTLDCENTANYVKSARETAIQIKEDREGLLRSHHVISERYLRYYSVGSDPVPRLDIHLSLFLRANQLAWIHCWNAKVVFTLGFTKCLGRDVCCYILSILSPHDWKEKSMWQVLKEEQDAKRVIKACQQLLFEHRECKRELVKLKRLQEGGKRLHQKIQTQKAIIDKVKTRKKELAEQLRTKIKDAEGLLEDKNLYKL
jgi:ribosomal protein S8